MPTGNHIQQAGTSKKSALDLLIPEDVSRRILLIRKLRAMFVAAEVAELNRSQYVTGSQKHRNTRYPPYAFTEYCTLMFGKMLKENLERELEPGPFDLTLNIWHNDHA